MNNYTVPNQLVEVSNHYGRNPDFVLAGGGNTSYKDDEYLYIKASGQSLGTITAEGFAVMDKSKLNGILKKEYSQDNDTRESEVLADLMDARLNDRRPSVETLLHYIMPQKYVVHTHPALVNAILCTPDSRRNTVEILGEDVIWIESIMPGYVLSKRIEKEIAAYGDIPPRCIVLENHGIFVAADTVEEIDKIYNDVTDKIKACIKIEPDFSPVEVVNVDEFVDKLSNAGFQNIRFVNNKEVEYFVKSKDSFTPISSMFTPDHLVYCGERPVFLVDINDLEKEMNVFSDEYHKQPKVIALQGVGVFVCGETAEKLFLDTLKIAIYTENFSKQQFLSQDMIDFISNWEVEKYRSNVHK